MISLHTCILIFRYSFPNKCNTGLLLSLFRDIRGHSSSVSELSLYIHRFVLIISHFTSLGLNGSRHTGHFSNVVKAHWRRVYSFKLGWLWIRLCRHSWWNLCRHGMMTSKRFFSPSFTVLLWQITHLKIGCGGLSFTSLRMHRLERVLDLTWRPRIAWMTCSLQNVSDTVFRVHSSMNFKNDSDGFTVLKSYGNEAMALCHAGEAVANFVKAPMIVYCFHSNEDTA